MAKKTKEFTCECGKVCKSKGGLTTHQKKCEAHKNAVNAPETTEKPKAPTRRREPRTPAKASVTAVPAKDPEQMRQQPVVNRIIPPKGNRTKRRPTDFLIAKNRA